MTTEKEAKNEGPYYLVKEGTNLYDRFIVSPYTYPPKIFDTKEIAQTVVDKNVKSRTKSDLELLENRVPISVAEYNRKYGKIMGKED